MLLLHPFLAYGIHYTIGHWDVIYICVGVPALFVSIGMAMREPQYVERVTVLAPRFFVSWGKA